MKLKKLTALLLALVMVMSLIACGSNNTSGNSNNSDSNNTSNQNDSNDTTPPAEPADDTDTVEPVTLNVGYMPNYASLWAVLCGINKGYFEEEGITVNLIEFADGAAEVAAMEGGTLDLAYIGKGAHRLCIIGQAVIFAPSSVHDTDVLVVTEDSGIESLSDLGGKNIAYTSVSEATLQNALDLGGVSRDDITATLLDIDYIASAMASGTVDGALTWNPYTDQILQNVEGTSVIEFDSGSTNMSSWICLPDYYEANRDVLVRYARALLKAMTYGADSANWEEVAQWVSEQTKTDYDACYAQVGDAIWFSADEVAADLADGTLAGYYESVMNDFLVADSITEDEVNDVANWVLLDVLQEAVDTMD